MLSIHVRIAAPGSGVLGGILPGLSGNADDAIVNGIGTLEPAVDGPGFVVGLGNLRVFRRHRKGRGSDERNDVCSS